MTSKRRASEEITISNPLDEDQGAEEPQEEPAAPSHTYTKVTLNRVDDQLLGRAKGFIAKVNMEGPLDGIDDLSDLFNNALAQYLPKLERKYNDGEEFKAPRRLPRGRKPTVR